MVEKYVKKPIVIEAIKVNHLNRKEVESFVGKELTQVLESDAAYQVGKYHPIFSLVIETLEGNMLAHDGDYIIKGVKGEFYPCKPDIFKATYEKLSNESNDNSYSRKSEDLLEKYQTEYWQILRHHAYDIKMTIDAVEAYGNLMYSVVLKVKKGFVLDKKNQEYYLKAHFWGVNLWKRYKQAVELLKLLYGENLYKHNATVLNRVQPIKNKGWRIVGKEEN